MCVGFDARSVTFPGQHQQGRTVAVNAVEIYPDKDIAVFDQILSEEIANRRGGGSDLIP